MFKLVLMWGSIAVIAGVPLVILWESFTDWNARRKRNNEFRSKHGNRLKLRCLNCRYCRKQLHRPFHTGKLRNAAVSYVPVYCKRFRVSLNPDYSTRCVAKDAAQAFYEDSSSSD